MRYVKETEIFRDQKSQSKISMTVKIAAVLAAATLTAGIMKGVQANHVRKIEMEKRRVAAEMKRIKSEVNMIKEDILSDTRVEKGEQILTEYVNKRGEENREIIRDACESALSNPNPDARITAMFYIGFSGYSGSNGSIPLISGRLLFDALPIVRYAAALVLGRMAHQELDEYGKRPAGPQEEEDLRRSPSFVAFEAIIKCLEEQNEPPDEIMRYKLLFNEGMTASLEEAGGEKPKAVGQ